MPNSVNNLNHSDNRAEFYEQLRLRERQWLHARQHLITLKQRQMFWFGDNSAMMWILWQLVSYVIVAIILMLLNKFLQLQLTLGQYMIVFVVQTLIFLTVFAFKGRLAKRLQNKIDTEDLMREQALSEMNTLAQDSIFPDIYANTPISLKDIYERYEAQLHIASLQRLLQREVDAGRLILGQQKTELYILPLELGDDNLTLEASNIIYKSVI